MIQERYYRYIPNLTHADGTAFGTKFRDELVQVTPNDERDCPEQVIP